MRTLLRQLVSGPLAAALVVGLSAAASAQGVTTAALSGSVTGPDGGPVVGASVTAVHGPSGATAGALTNESGRYFIPNLRPGGPYRVAVRSIGFAESVQDEVHLSLGQELRLDFELAEQAIELEALTVLATSPAFSAARTGAGSTVDRRTLDNLPTLNRTFTDAVVFSPHVIQDGRATSVGGQNNRFNNIQIDGAVNNDIFGLGGAAGVPGGQANARPISMEAIQEYQILVAPFDVRQSGFSGGLINAITRSGTNQFSGSLYGYYRNQDFVGDLDGRPFDEFTNYNAGLTLGGPIIHDRMHFFVSAELETIDEPQVGFHVGTHGAGETGITSAAAEEIRSIAEDTGLNPGDFGPITRGNPLRNLFARVDYRLSDRHRLTLRHNYVNASLDRPIDRRGGFAYDFTSYMIDQNNETNSTVAQLLSNFGDWSNEALLTFSFIRDRRNPQFFEPTFHVEFSDPDAPGSPGRRVRFGAEYFSHANELDQDNIQFTNNLTRSFGDHRLTFGVHTEYFGFRNLFHPGSLGRYSYDSIENFRNNVPYRYEIEVPHPQVDDVTAEFGVLQVGGYVQNQWTVSGALTLTAGLRVDVPVMLDDPMENTQFAQAFSQFGYRTSSIPSGNPLWAPRLGFNWTPNTTMQTQVRGGVGIFSGRPPFVWMSNAYGNTGMTTLFLRCDGPLARSYDPSNPSPTTCADGSGAGEAGAAVVNIFDENFKFPQELKANLAVDRELPLGFIGTAEVLYTHAVNQIYLQEVNHQGQQGVDPATGRPVFGVATASGWQPVRHSDDFLNVVRGTNTSDNNALVLSFELQRRFVDMVDVRGAYTFSRVRDTQTLGSSIATSNVGFNPVPGHPNEAPLARSNFERPHKLLLSGTVRLLERFGGTDLTLIYVGQSGRPYAYTIDGDVNGDLYPGPGTRATNDLLYVPSGGELAFVSASDQALFEQLIDLEPCLQRQRGQIMARNSCRAPWTNMIDLRLAHNVAVGPRSAQLIVDVFNVANLLNSSWGRIEGPTFSEISALQLVGRENGTADSNDRLMYRYIGSTDADGNAALPYVTFAPASQWQAQVGIRYTF